MAPFFVSLSSGRKNGTIRVGTGHSPEGGWPGVLGRQTAHYLFLLIDHHREPQEWERWVQVVLEAVGERLCREEAEKMGKTIAKYRHRRMPTTSDGYLRYHRRLNWCSALRIL